MNNSGAISTNIVLARRAQQQMLRNEVAVLRDGCAKTHAPGAGRPLLFVLCVISSAAGRIALALAVAPLLEGPSAALSAWGGGAVVGMTADTAEVIV